MGNVILCKEIGEDLVKKLNKNLPFDWNFYYRHAVDDHSNFRHALSSIGDTLMTDRWECQVFAFYFDHIRG